MKLLTLTILLLVFVTPAISSDVNFMVEEITDTRSAGGYSSDLKIKLKPIGDDVMEATALKVMVTEAIDDTGKSLINDEKTKDSDFVFPGGSFGYTEIELKNPKRRSTTIKKLTADVALYNPEKDSSAIAVISDFVKKENEELVHKSLANSNVKIRIISKLKYEELKSKNEEQLKKEGAMSGLAQEMMNALGSLFGGFMQVDENSIILLVSDPESKIIKIEFLDENAKKITTDGSMQSGDNRVYNFKEKLPDSSKLRIYLETKKSISFTKATLNDIALP